MAKSIKLVRMKYVPSYLGDTDAVTSTDFLESKYAADYSMDTSNINWGAVVRKE